MPPPNDGKEGTHTTVRDIMVLSPLAVKVQGFATNIGKFPC